MMSLRPPTRREAAEFSQSDQVEGDDLVSLFSLQTWFLLATLESQRERIKVLWVKRNRSPLSFILVSELFGISWKIPATANFFRGTELSVSDFSLNALSKY